MFTEFPLNDWRTQVDDVVLVEMEEPEPDIDDEPDFSEYMWMENEEEFDKMEMDRLEEEYRMRECIAAMLADALDEHISELEKAGEAKWVAELLTLPIIELDVAHSKLNPLAKEFVPSGNEVNWDN